MRTFSRVAHGLVALLLVTLPFYWMRDEGIPVSMQLGQFPSTFLFAKSGALVMEHTGAANWAAPEVSRAIDRLKDE